MLMYSQQKNHPRGDYSLLRLLVLIVQSALITSLWLVANGARHARDAQPITSWTLDEDSWNQWWSYSGVSGPAYWGLLNSDWFMCDKGRRQSPIDLNTKALVYDPYLTAIRADNNLISGVLYNDGHSIVFNGSTAALVRFVSIKDQHEASRNKERPGQHTNDGSSLPVHGNSSGTSETVTNSNHPISRRDTATDANELFALMQDTKDHFELVDSKNGFVVEAVNGGSSDSAAPLLISELGNSVDFSISESDRLQSLASTSGDLQRQLPAEESFQDESDQLSSDSASDLFDPASGSNRVHFTGAGLAYSYRFEALQIKFGSSQATAIQDGSEHRIDGRPFAAELQLYAYNWQLYRNYEESSTRPNGLMAISILIDTFADHGKANKNNNNYNNLNEPHETVNQKSPTTEGQRANGLNSQTSNGQLERLLLAATDSLNHRGAFVAVRDLNLSALLPETEQFVTYEGSLTQPGCHESVTWLILNRPLYISKQILERLKSISADELLAPNPSGTLLAGNTRNAQPINNRPIRTNIRPPSKQMQNNKRDACPRLWTRYEYTRQGTTS